MRCFPSSALTVTQDVFQFMRVPRWSPQPSNMTQGARHRSAESGGKAALPVVFEAAIKMGAAEGEDGVGAADGPEHTGLFEAMADDGFAAGLDDAGADEQMLLAELGIVHPSGVGGEVVGVVAKFLGQLSISGLDLAKGSDEFSDLAFIEPTFLMQAYPGVAALSVGRMEQARQVPQMLAGVEQIDDLNGAGKVFLGEVPDPFRAIADHYLLCGAAPAALPSFDIKPLAKLLGIL